MCRLESMQFPELVSSIVPYNDAMLYLSSIYLSSCVIILKDCLSLPPSLLYVYVCDVHETVIIGEYQCCIVIVCMYVYLYNTGDISTAISLEPAMKFNGGGHVNHSIFWTNLSPQGGGVPKG